MKHPLPQTGVQQRMDNPAMTSPEFLAYDSVVSYPMAPTTSPHQPASGVIQRFDDEDEKGLETIFNSKEFQNYYRFDPKATQKGTFANMASDKALTIKQHFNVIRGKDKGGKDSATSSHFTEDRKDEAATVGRKILGYIPYVGTIASLNDARKAKKQARANLMIVANSDNPFIRNIALGQLLNLMEERRSAQISAGISVIPFGELISDVIPNAEEIIRKIGEKAAEKITEYSAEHSIEKAVGIPRPALEAQLAASKNEIAYHELIALDPKASESIVHYLERETDRDRELGQEMTEMKSPSANPSAISNASSLSPSAIADDAPKAPSLGQKLSLADQVGEYKAWLNVYMASEDEALEQDGINQLIRTLAAYMAQATRLSMKGGQEIEMVSSQEHKGTDRATEQLQSMFEKEMFAALQKSNSASPVMPIWQAKTEKEENDCL